MQTEINLQGKTIILGVTGSIAAYKAPLIARELTKSGANVYSILTPSATEFVTPLTMSNVTRNSVIVEMFDIDTQKEGAWHIDLSHSADAMLIAPCSATTLAKLATSLCDNSLISVATALPRQTPLIIAPAMDSTMWLHPATQRNVEQLKADGAIIIPPDDGDLSSGLVGPGRMPDVTLIKNIVVETLRKWKQSARYQAEGATHQVSERENLPLETIEESVFKDKFNSELELEELKSRSKSQLLAGKKVIVTAGPTYEKIDDVRYIANRSSGKMGYAIAEEAAARGADVTLVSGPTELETSTKINRVNVESAKEMFYETVKAFEGADIAVLAAAVADYAPEEIVAGKIKKSDRGEQFDLHLVATKDILKHLGTIKKPNQKLIGFALESSNATQNGWKKLKDKNCDMIVLNVNESKNSVFGSDDNKISLLKSDGSRQDFPLMRKSDAAKVILDNATETMKR